MTSLRDGCTSIVAESPSAQRTLCAGEGGYQPIVLSDSLRENLEIQAPQGNVVPMDFFAKVSAAPSRLSDTVEWRYADANSNTPIALVVGLNTDTNGGDAPNYQATPSAGSGSGPDQSQVPETTPANDTHLIWIVIKLDPTHSCVVNSVDGNSPNAHEQALRIADQAQEWGCV